MFAIYYTFHWTPPELSLPEKVWLGKKILKVGPNVFAAALKKRLADVSNKKPFTWDDIFEDIKNPPSSPATSTKVLATSAVAVGTAAVIAAAGAALVIPMIAVTAATGGSYLWMARKIDLWIRDVIAVTAIAQIEDQKIA
jgi:hypothetical protein